jgi:hypothetical protein
MSPTVLNVLKHTGKKEIRQQALLLGEQVVLQLTENFWGKWHHIYFNNFFTSTNLMKMLLEQETYSCGTTRENRQNWPIEFRKPAVLKLKRGESKKMQHEDVIFFPGGETCFWCSM